MTFEKYGRVFLAAVFFLCFVATMNADVPGSKIVADTEPIATVGQAAHISLPDLIQSGPFMNVEAPQTSPNAVLLWDNTNINVTTSGIVSNDLRGRHPDSSLVNTADDFVVPAGVQWSVDSIYARGFSTVTGAVDSFAVAIYQNDPANKPGTRIYYRALIPANGLPRFDSLKLKLPSPVVLGSGTYWLSVYAIYNTGTVLSQTRWNWYNGPTAVGLTAHIQDFTGLFGIPPFPWATVTSLGVANPSNHFALYGTSQSLPTGPSIAYAVDVRNQRLVKINLGTGAVTAFGGATGGRPFYAGDFGGNGVWYAVSTPDTLYSIDTTTGAFTNLGLITGLPAASNTSGMTWDYSTNTMYLSNLVGGVATLYTLNLTTRVATSIGPILSGTIIDIAASNGGQIYGIKFATAAGVSDSLVSINKATGAGTIVGPLGVDVNFAHGLDFDPATDSLFYPGYIGGGVNNLYKINTTTGAAGLLFSLAAGEYDAFSVRAAGSSSVSTSGTEIPSGFDLSQNYPNPFNPSTTIKFAIPVKERVTLQIYNALGQLVATLHDGELNAGTFEATWNASGIASGVYYYRLQAGNFTQTKSLVLLK